MVIFLFPQFKYLSKALKTLPDYRTGFFQTGRFLNQEIYVRLSTPVLHKDCLIIGSITPPDEQLVSFVLLTHTLKKELAAKIIALVPYLAYARQDQNKKGESLATSAIGEIFRASHIDEVVTIDVHSRKVKSLFPLPIQNLSTAKLFAGEIKKLKLKNPVFVSPDEGAIERTQQVIDELGLKAKIVYMKKVRSAGGISSVLHGHIRHDAIVIDDILDTGQTLVACCKNLKAKGAKKIYIFVTHGFFTGKKWQELFNLNVQRIYCTDSVPGVYNLRLEKLKICSIRPILREYAHNLRKVQEESKKEIKKREEEKQDFFLGEEVG